MAFAHSMPPKESDRAPESREAKGGLTPRTSSHSFAFATVTVLFLLSILGPFAWFHGGTPKSSVQYSFNARSQLSGFGFRPIPVNAAARQELGTTNLFSGAFSNSTLSVIAFFADWSAAQGQQMN